MLPTSAHTDTPLTKVLGSGARHFRGNNREAPSAQHVSCQIVASHLGDVVQYPEEVAYLDRGHDSDYPGHDLHRQDHSRLRNPSAHRHVRLQRVFSVTAESRYRRKSHGDVRLSSSVATFEKLESAMYFLFQHIPRKAFLTPSTWYYYFKSSFVATKCFSPYHQETLLAA